MYMDKNPSFYKDVTSIKNMMKDLQYIEKTETSENFINNLYQTIDKQENSLWQKIYKFDFFTSSYFPATGLAAAILIIISSSYIAFNQNSNKHLNIDSYSSEQESLNNHSDLTDKDSIKDSSKTEIEIRLVGGKK